MLLFFFINLFSFFIILKISYLFFNLKYYYPFRVAEISAFFINNLLALIVMIYFFDLKIILLILFINSLLSYTTYHICNMIQTSPRTKILLDLYNLKTITKAEYYNLYTIENILDYRLKRFASSKQIEINDKLIKLNITKNSFLNLVFNIFKLMKFF